MFIILISRVARCSIETTLRCVSIGSNYMSILKVFKVLDYLVVSIEKFIVIELIVLD